MNLPRNKPKGKRPRRSNTPGSREDPPKSPTSPTPSQPAKKLRLGSGILGGLPQSYASSSKGGRDQPSTAEEKELMESLRPTLRTHTYGEIGLGLPKDDTCFTYASEKAKSFPRQPTVSHLIRYLEELADRIDRENNPEEFEQGLGVYQSLMTMDPGVMEAIDKEVRSIWKNEIQDELEADKSQEELDAAEHLQCELGADKLEVEEVVVDELEAEEVEVDKLEEESVLLVRQHNTSHAGSISELAEGECSTLEDPSGTQTPTSESGSWAPSETESVGTGSSTFYPSTDEAESNGNDGDETPVDTRPLSEIIAEEGVELEDMTEERKIHAIRGRSLLELYHLHVQGTISEEEAALVLSDRLDRKLRHWGLKARSLLRLLEGTQSLISGSFFFLVTSEEVAYETGDIDMYTVEDYYLIVIEYLKSKGYTSIKKIRLGYRTTLDAVSTIYELYNHGGRKINVVVSVGMAVLPILHFHSTLVMNYISYHGLVCLYETTMHAIGLMNYNQPFPEVIQQCVQKYVSRGYTMSMRLEDPHECGEDSCCPQTIRSLFDSHVLHIRFKGYQDIPVKQLRRSEANHAVWRLSTGSECHEETWDNTGFVACNTEYTVMCR
ncbi:hypothetical protein MD484_g2750, partial [Candolleomyces efflorescens]